MKTIMKSGIYILVAAFSMNQTANAFCGFGWVSATPPPPPPVTCSCPANKVAIKHVVDDLCAEEKCVSSGAATHYLNQGWIYGCCAVARLDVNKSALEISIYPNPVTDRFTIYNPESVIKSIEISDVYGHRIFSSQLTVKSQQQLRMDASGWTGGIYFVTVTTEQDIISKKIIVK